MKRRVLSDEGFPEGGYSGASFSIRHLSVRLFSLVDLKIFQQIRNRLRPQCVWPESPTEGSESVFVLTQ